MACLSKSEMVLRGQALEVALLAKCGSVEKDQVDALWGRAHVVLDPGDPFLIAVQDFCCAWARVRRSNRRLNQIGNDLADAVVRTLPDLKQSPQSQFDWQQRKDING